MGSAPLGIAEAEAQDVVRRAWRAVLGAAPEGAQDDFFRAGGDSIGAAKLVARLSSHLAVELSLGAFVDDPTPAALVGQIVSASAPTEEIHSPAGPTRASFAQERFWFIDQTSGASTVANVAWAMKLDGELDAAVLSGAHRALTSRHDALRTRFAAENGEPIQVVEPTVEPEFETFDCSGEDDPEGAARRLLDSRAQEPFDLTKAPLLRLQLVRLGENAHVLQFVAHHIICDDWSKGVLQRDLAALYAREDVSPPGVQYPAFAEWQRKRFDGPDAEAELRHWQDRLAGAPPSLEIATDHPRPRVPSNRGARLRTSLPADAVESLRALGRAAGASFYMTMLATFESLLHRYTHEDDLVVGTAIDNRGRVEFENAVGLFTNVLALRTDLSGSPTFHEVVARVRETTLDAIAHQELPFDQLVALLPDRDPGRHPIFQAFFEFIVPAPLALPIDGIAVQHFDVPKRTAEFDLGLYLDEGRGGLDAVWEYSTDLYDTETIARIADHYIVLLRAIVATPDRAIDELPLLDGAERESVVATSHGEVVEAHPGRLETLFAAQAARTPDRPALVAAGETLSYTQLNKRANRIAHRLRALGVNTADTVGLCLDRSPDLIAAVLGILKAGAAYVPLNADHPPPRLQQQLHDAGARVVVTRSDLADSFGLTTLCVDRDRNELAAEPTTDPPGNGTADDPVYVMYTSGSTGVPKGVVVRQRNLVNYVTHMLRTFEAEASVQGWTFAAVSAISTDLGNTTIFPSLVGGGCLHLVSESVSTDGDAFADYVASCSLDVLKITPSHLRTLLDASGGRPILPKKWLVLGGEALRWDLAERITGPRVLNHYGPTEATVGCCTYELDLDAPRPSSATVPIGRPISNAAGYVLDRLGSPLPPGVPGELYVGGAGVAAGYAGRPEETAERFVADAFSRRPDARLYRTGDLVRLLRDGNIEFLGRADDQVKIRGFRVEPGEVESAIEGCAGVDRAVVLSEADGDDKRLVAFVVGTASAEAVRSDLEATLPPYMVPSNVVVVEQLPLTPNGKLDRRALLAIAAPRAATAAPFDGDTATGVEAELLAVWSELLGHDAVGVHDNFFEVGGHSLLAIRLLARLKTDFETKLTLKQLIDEPTVAALAARVAESRGERADTADAEPKHEAAPIPHADRSRPVRCSFAQEQLWLVDQLTPESAAYNFSWPMRLRGSLDIDALSTAATEVVRRHEALRTRFVVEDGQPMQLIDEPAETVLEIVDVSTAADPDAAARAIVDAATRAHLDLRADALFQLKLLRLADDHHILHVLVHHIVFDGVSKVVLYRDLADMYRAFAAGENVSAPALPVQYADYAAWQRSSLGAERLEGEVAYWRTQLDGAPTALELPTDHPRPPVASMRGARHRQAVPHTLRDAVDALARAEGSTPFMVLLAAFDVLLSRYAGQEDIVVGAPVDTRARPELDGVVGPFLNTIVLRNDLSGDPTFRELLARVRERTVDAIAHQDVPFERLVEALQPSRDLSRHPIFQVLLALNPREISLELDGVEVDDIDPQWSSARVDLFLVLDDLPRGLETVWEYSTDLFDAQTIERMSGHFMHLLEEVVRDPGRRIGELRLLGETERASLTAVERAIDIPDVRVEQLVRAQVAANPDRIAVEFEGETMTYGELNEQANKLAHHLLGLGVRAEEPVGISVRRSEQLLVALLATMKAGAAYVPIDPAFPAERRGFMVSDAGVRIVVTEEALTDQLPDFEGRLVLLDVDAGKIAGEPATEPTHDAGPDGLAYVIYTSGSTGTPKGVEIDHRSLVNFLTSMRTQPGLESDDVLAAVTTLSFDIAGLELYLPLVAGARVVIAPEETAADPRRLSALLDDTKATVMQATPATWRMLVDVGWPGRPGLRVLCGGEALPPALADELLDRGLELWNMYGPTETTIWSTVGRVQERGAPITLGRPIANTSIYILDSNGEPAPTGVPGELCIGGAGVARGYRGRPELTAERFVPDRFAEREGARLYRTGDVARRRADGSLQFLGRRDQQVKVRGFRIELEEVETQLMKHPRITAAAASTYTDGPSESVLVAYVVAASDPPSAAELRNFLSTQLPAYMVPSIIVTLDELPLTPNGKVDRNALPAPTAETETAHVAPRNPQERQLAQLFADVLGREAIGIDDNFFELGGHSLLATRLLARIARDLNADVPLRAIFERPTVRALAPSLETDDRPEVEEPPPIVAVARSRRASFAQERFWFIEQFAGPAGAGAYNISWPVRLRGALDVSSLQRALDELVRRHDALRTRFSLEDGRPVQVVDASRTCAFELVDLRTEGNAEQTAQRLVDEETVAPFDLERGPLFRARLLRLGDDDHILQLVVHHIVADAWTKSIIFRELSQLYASFAQGAAPALAPPALQYGDYAEWQRSWLSGDRLERELSHWLSELDGAPAALELPTDRPRPPVASMRGAWKRSSIDARVVEGLTNVARSEGATLFMALLAAFDVLLARYSGQTDIVVGAPVDGRTRPELEGVVGPFVNTLVLRNDISGEPTFRQIVTRVRESTLRAISHQELPFERLVEALQPERDVSRHAVYQVMLSLNPTQAPLLLGPLALEELRTEKAAARTDLTLILESRDAALEAVWEYSTDLFADETIERMAQHFRQLLESVAADPDQTIPSIQLTDMEERRRLLTDSEDGTEAHFAAACLHDLFEAQVERSPEATAVTYDGESVSYRELNARANRLAHRLRDLGVRPETRVALLLDRSIDLVVAIVGVLKAGGAYVPLDSDYPSERLRFMLDDAQPAVIVTHTGALGLLPQERPNVVCLDHAPELEHASAENPAASACPENVAYVIYTSGSTGKPKGVEVEHRQVARLFAATDAWFEFGPSDVWTLLHSYAFDFSVWELWGALLHGGRLVVVPQAVVREPEALARVVAEEHVTVLNATPSLFSAITDPLLERADELTLRLVIFGGEALRPASLRRWFGRLGDRGPQLVNMYGITETTVHVTYRPISAADTALESSPIGRAIPDLQLYVLNEQLEPVPAGVPGELFVGGDGVARGYLNRPELTAQRFLQNPFGAGRLYRTGDRVRRLADGSLEFHGRIDDQVKIRGYRIELGEIEATLRDHELVAEAAVVPFHAAEGDTRLAAYVVPDERRAGVIRRFLRLQSDGRIPPEDARELPNGMPIVHANNSETDYLYDDIFVNASYLKHGIALPRGACVFDVGANIGLFSLFVHAAAPDARIFAFEPMPTVFEKLSVNTELHGLDAVLVDSGVGAAETAGTFTFMPNNTLASGRFVDVDEERISTLARVGENGSADGDGIADELIAERLTTEILVRPMTTLSRVIADHAVEQIDLLKVDAEKSEWDVLQGLADEDWPKIRQIVIEVHGGPEDSTRVVDLLEARGFAVTADGDIVYARRGGVVPAPASRTSGWQSPARLRTELRSHLKRRLPEYMVPSITLLSDLPLTVNGKLDRRRLPESDREESAATQAAPARTANEEALIEMWKELLRTDAVGTDDDFFELGGHSLLVAQLAARIRERFAVAVSVHAIFEEPTIAALARRIDSMLEDPLARLGGEGSAGVAAGIRRRERGAAFPLSSSQEQLWLLDQWDPGAPTYNVALPFRLRGALDVEALGNALEGILARHEVFRTVIRLEGDTPTPMVRDDMRIDLAVTDLSDRPTQDRMDAALDLVRELAARPFDLAGDLLLRATLIRLDDEEHLLLLETHHIAFDGWSETVLFDELAALYAGRELPEPPLQFGDFALWQQQHLRGDVLDAELRFWRRYLGGAPTSIDLPTDHPRPEGRRFRGATHDVELPGDVAAAIRALCREERVTPYIVLLAALATVLYRTTGQDDVLIGSPFANRPGREVERVIGFFSNTLVFRARLNGNPTFRQLLGRVRELAIDAYAHHEIPFEKVVAALRPQREVGVNPLFQVNFRVRTSARPKLELEGLAIEPLHIDVGITRFDFALDLEASDAAVRGYFRYNGDIFEPATIARIATDFSALLADALTDPDRRLLSLALGDDAGTAAAPTATAGIRGKRDRARATT